MTAAPGTSPEEIDPHRVRITGKDLRTASASGS